MLATVFWVCFFLCQPFLFGVQKVTAACPAPSGYYNTPCTTPGCPCAAGSNLSCQCLSGNCYCLCNAGYQNTGTICGSRLRLTVISPPEGGTVNKVPTASEDAGVALNVSVSLVQSAVLYVFSSAVHSWSPDMHHRLANNFSRAAVPSTNIYKLYLCSRHVDWRRTARRNDDVLWHVPGQFQQFCVFHVQCKSAKDLSESCPSLLLHPTECPLIVLCRLLLIECS